MLRSFRSRLLVATTLWICLALVASGVMLSRLFHNQVHELFEDELRGHLEELVDLVEVGPDGQPGLRQTLVDKRFGTPGSGYYWQIDTASGGGLRSGSLGERTIRDLSGPSAHRFPGMLWGLDDGLRIMTAVKSIGGAAPPIEVTIAAEAHVIGDVVARFRDELALAFGLLGIGLIAGSWATLSFGLRPLRRIGDALKAIHAGRAAHMPSGLPDEVGALAEDLNTLIDRNQVMLMKARSDAGRLAHGLKTPLAILLAEANRLSAPDQQQIAQVLIEQCNRMRRLIDFQLVTGQSSPGTLTRNRQSASAGDIARKVIIALSTLYKDRNLDFSLDGGDTLKLDMDERDLEEIMGNLVDNACKWARHAIAVSIEAGPAGQCDIRVEDDGPGLPPDRMEAVFQPGTRLDAAVPGSGLGLAIVRDLVSRVGGRAWIETSQLGGAALCVTIPLDPVTHAER